MVMKPLTHCPGCQSELIKKTIPEELNHTKYENCSKRCTVDYFQYYDKSYEDSEIQYASFRTPDDKFSLYYYTNHGAYPSKTVHIYSQQELHVRGRAMPIIRLKDFTIDFDNLEKLQEKLGIYALFA
jgi:hypothetical protein